MAMLSSLSLAFASCGNNKTPGEQPEEHTHTYSDAWSADENGHWHAATCEHTENKRSEGAHFDGDNSGNCDVCGYKMKREDSGSNDQRPPTPEEYLVFVEDEQGNRIAGVDVILYSADGSASEVLTTNEQGWVAFLLPMGEWQAALANPVDGYTNTTADRYNMMGIEVTIILTK